MNMEYVELWFFLSKAWERAYSVYKTTKDDKFLKHCNACTACEEIVRPYEFMDKAETGI